jgi:glycosyltransferase involved in cell wall biosynthesis
MKKAKRSNSQNMKVLHAPENLAGQASMIAMAQKELGIESDVLVFDQNYLNYECDINLALSEKPRATALLIKLTKALLIKLTNFVRCLFKYDIFHFHFARSLLPRNLDLPILKLFGKKIVMQYWGSDIRQLDIAKKYKYHYAREMEIDPKKEERKRRKIKWINKFADITIVGDYELLEYSPNSVIVERAFDVSKINFKKDNFDKDKKLKIVHSPTNTLIKGTKYITDAVERLKREGYDFEFVSVENKPHDKALKIYEDADIVIDQLLIGFYGVFAIECMAIGKPVLCYIREDIEKYHSNLPILSTNPDNICDNLKLLIENIELRKELGEKGKKYVEEMLDSRKIAKQMIELYKSI